MRYLAALATALPASVAAALTLAAILWVGFFLFFVDAFIVLGKWKHGPEISADRAGER